jgi:hypothetical protein
MTDETLPPPPRGLAWEPIAAAPAEKVAQADREARFWQWPESGPMAPGSDEQKRAACRMFRETFNSYKPSVIAWPEMDQSSRQRLITLPIWDIAVQTEGKARLRMTAYAHMLADPEWRAAIEQNGWEEGRHKEVLAKLVSFYGIPLEPEPRYVPPRDPEWAYLVTGYSECVDSFFAFGLFELARRSSFFPPELVETFEPVIQEEARHILLFANWLAWQRRHLNLVRRIVFEVRVLAVWAFLVWERIGIARGLDDKSAKPQDNNFTLTGSQAVSGADIRPGELLDICLAENERRFAGYDKRLLRPTTTPLLARIVRRFLKPPRAAMSSAAPA